MSQAISILLIDDEPCIGDALSIVLSDHGYRVAVALNGRDGINLADSEQFSVVITDLRLPDLSGLDVLCHVKVKAPDCPVVIITAHATPELVAEAERLGASKVLAKPFFPSDILSLIEMWLVTRSSLDTASPTDGIEDPAG